MKTTNKFGGDSSKYQDLMKNLIISTIWNSRVQISCLFILTLSVLSCKNETIPGYTSAFATSNTENEITPKMPDSVMAQIIAKRNFFEDSCLFSIPEDQNIRILAYGEGADYKVNPALIESYDNDGVEVYFDMKNEKFPYFNLNGDDRQYRILWNLLQIDGQNINTDGLEVKESDPTPQSYIMEMKFPWKSLGYINPAENVKIGFDVAVLDNDGKTRDALLSWFSTDWESWNNTSYFGTLVLGNYNTHTDKKNAISMKTENPPFIDGRIDKLWTNPPQYNFKNVISGKLDNERDLSGYYKSCWDNNYLYLLVNVNDDIKSYASVLFDYGWIEDLQGNIVWKMEMKQTKHAGGGLKNRYTDTIINLKKGQYYLRYQTDESNSPANWDVEPPKDDFYGIKLIRQ
jgi:hypothetical protein